jgi:carboxypeptidase PM20D1
VIAILAATESLLTSGWAPARPVYLAFGHNEEAAAAARPPLPGDCAIRASTRIDPRRGRRESWTRAFQGWGPADRGRAIAEKGVMNLEICALAAPGHSSTPPPTTAIGTLSAAIREARRHIRPPAASIPLVRETLTYAAAE